MTTKPNLQILARQGDTSAIAILLEDHLHSQQVTTQVSRKADLLQILIESPQLTPKPSLVAMVKSLLSKLRIEGIEQVKVYGRKEGDKSPAWKEEFAISANQPALSLPQKKVISKLFRKIIYLYLITLVLIILAFFDITYTLPLAIITGCICVFLLVTSEDYQREQEDWKTQQARLAERRRWEVEALAKAQKLANAAQEETFQDLINPQESPAKQLKTNIAFLALIELQNLEFQINSGLTQVDLYAVMSPVRSQVQEFTLSPDYEVSPYLSNLIEKTLLYQELCLECYKLKRLSLDSYKQASAISTRCDLGKLVRKEFPYLKTIGLADLAEQKLSDILVADLSARYYDFELTIDECKDKSAIYINELQQIFAALTSHKNFT